EIDLFAGAAAHGEGLGRCQKLNPLFAEDPLHLLRDVSILAGHDLPTRLDDRDAAAEAAKGLRHLDADIATAEHNETPRRLLEFEGLDMRQRLRRSKAANLGDRGMRPEVEEQLIGREHARAAVVESHLKRLRGDKISLAGDQLGAARLEVFPVELDFMADHVALAARRGFHVDDDGAGHDAELLAVSRKLRHPRAPDLGLAGHAGDVGAGAADPAALDQRGAPARPRQMPGDQLASLAAPEHQNIVMFNFGHGLSPIAIVVWYGSNELDRRRIGTEMPQRSCSLLLVDFS